MSARSNATAAFRGYAGRPNGKRFLTDVRTPVAHYFASADARSAAAQQDYLYKALMKRREKQLEAPVRTELGVLTPVANRVTA